MSLDTKSYQVVGAVWIEKSDGTDRFLGKGRIQLMELIIEHGSISQAAKAMNMSYKRAWELINSMNVQSAKPFVITQVGGKRGGGAVVTEEGIKAIAEYKDLQARFIEFLEQESKAFNQKTHTLGIV
ncbi:winged helix-turn-helix domain-containing protein [Flectobacillus sp. BAB-3569]|uniref:winged helix-turn-helix domain-containing protein n=1 Tax=Flectobacillus sp. BAB-3569 TaxID=1509483 RepID=UPI000BA48A60|nr:LysR family transcriptional regulator [Flectobacillus sp. BAB-3569]PAC33136.1 ModE family transcriptional regulator [Flectobacillus sp. BAB-3569]